MLRQSVVESGVEHCHLRRACSEQATRRQNSFDVIRIVQRGELNTVLNPFQNLIGNDGRLGEALTSVHYAMPNRVNVARPVHLLESGFVRDDPAQNKIQRRRNVPDRSSQGLLSRSAFRRVIIASPPMRATSPRSKRWSAFFAIRSMSVAINSNLRLELPEFRTRTFI